MAVDDLAADLPAAVAFLEAYAPGGPWCLVAIEPDPAEGQNPRAPGTVLSDPRQALQWLSDHQRWNLYYAVNETAPDVRTTPKKAQITGLRALHVDVDVSHAGQPTQIELDRALARLRSIEPAASAITFSGGGYHAIWTMPATLPAGEIARVERICASIAASAAGGDHCWNANRLLRLPGTVNWLSRVKRARGRVPSATFLVESDFSRTWSIEHDPIPRVTAIDDEDDDATVAPLGAAVPTAGEHDVEELPARLRKVIVLGDVTRWAGDRNRGVFYVCCTLARRGWPDDAILPLITEPRYQISAHVREQSNPEIYARRQLRDARARIAQDWERTSTGAISGKSQSNIRRALAEMGVNLSYNEFSGRAWVNGTGPARNWDDDSELTIRLEIDARHAFMPDKEIFYMVVRRLSLDNTYHPVRQRLSELQPTWDGVARVDTWLIECGGAKDTPYVRAVSRLVLVAAVRRVRDPGCKFDEMLVLVDPRQGTDKSTALRVLAMQTEWLADSLPLGLDPRKIIERTRGKWICEASDLAGMDKRHVAEMKDFLSRQSDLDRMVWDRHPTEVFRQWIVIGTTNELAFLKDDQNRRFWPVRTHKFDIPLLTSIVPQLWAEAASLESHGESIRLDPGLWDEAAEVQAQARAPEPWAEVFVQELGGMTGRLAAADAWKIIDKPTGFRSQEDNRRLGGAMRELGWERSLQRFGPGAPPQGAYVKGTVEEQRRIIYVHRDPVTRVLSISYDRPGNAHDAGLAEAERRWTDPHGH